MKSWSVVSLLGLIVMFAWLVQFMWQPFDPGEREAMDDFMAEHGERIAQLRAKVQPEDIQTLAPQAIQGDEIDQGLNWLTEGNLDEALSFFREDIVSFANNPELVEQLALQLVRAGRYQEALALMYEYRLFVSFEQEDALLDSIFSLVAQIESIFDSQEDHRALIELYSALISWHADHSPYYLRLAYWQMQQGAFEEAEQSLLGVRNDIEYSEDVAELTELLEALANADEAPQAIPLIKENGQFALEMTVAEELQVKLMLDTGAGMTTIKSAVLDQLSASAFNELGELSLNTANGVVVGRKVQVGRLRFGNTVLENTEVAVIPLESIKYDGLLGMNVLSQFEFFIDQQSAVMYIK